MKNGIIESQKSHNSSCWKGPPNVIQSNLLLEAGTTSKLQEVAQNFVPLNFEIFKIQTIFDRQICLNTDQKKNLKISLSGKTVPVSSHSHCEILFPCAKAEFLFLHLVTIASSPLSILYEIYKKPSRKHFINSASCFYFPQDIPDNFPYFYSTNFYVRPVFLLSGAFKTRVIHAAFLEGEGAGETRESYLFKLGFFFFSPQHISLSYRS